MYGQEQFERIVRERPHRHKTFFTRPHFTRRRFFEVLGAGVTGSYLIGRPGAAQRITPALDVTTKNTATNVIFILLAGAPSHVDTFDFKMTDGVTPAAAQPETINGVLWPTGIFPKLKDHLSDFALVRSMRAWALVHTLAQTWTQIGRNPAAALGDIAPNIGSIVAIEKAAEATPGQVFPAFVALNSASGAGQGYLSAAYAPFRVAPSLAGLPDTTNVDGQTRLEDRWSLLHHLDTPLRVDSPLGKAPEDMDNFYNSAKALTYNPVVKQAFSYTAADSARFGSTGFGNACLLAKQILAADKGTRFVQITVGGWDMHQNIYGAGGDPTKGNNIFTLGQQLDAGVAGLLGDLKDSGLFDRTMIVMVGEFGRTVGKLSGANGRDHYPQQTAFFAGGGIKGGTIVGSTNSDGSATADPGWSRQRDVKPEDIEATIYSAMGINWTTVRYDDPFGRGYEYVPMAGQDLYGPIHELWG